MNLKLFSFDDVDKNKTFNLSDQIYFYIYNESVVHYVILNSLYYSHNGSKSQKNRSEVSGGGIKPWRQKGTGRARAGSIRSPIFRKGGVTFASKPLKKSKKINKNIYIICIKSILSSLFKLNMVLLIDSIFVNEISTSFLFRRLNNFLNYDKLLVVIHISEYSKDLLLSYRNIKNISLCFSSYINPLMLLSFDRIIITSLAILDVQEVLNE